MNEDILIKSVLFGGFDKNDVLKHIEKIQSEHYDESETIKQKDEEIEALKEKAAQFEDKLASEQRRFSALAALNDEYCERIYNLEEQIKEQCTRFDHIQEDCNRLKKVEAQIGALLVDAVLYSDKMTEKAKTVATNITTDAKNALVSTAQSVNELSLEIVQISSGFGHDITALVEKVESLSASLSFFADRFESECDISREKAYDTQEVFEHFFAHGDNVDKETDEEAQEDAKNDNLPENNTVSQDSGEINSLEPEEIETDEILEKNEFNVQPELSNTKEEPSDITDLTKEMSENEVTDIWDYKTKDTKPAEQIEQAETSEKLSKPEESEEVEQFDEPEKPEVPEELQELEEPEEAQEPQEAQEPEDQEKPEEPKEPEESEQLDENEEPEEPEEPEKPEKTEEPEEPQMPEIVAEFNETESNDDSTDLSIKESRTSMSRDISESDVDELLRLFSNDADKTNS